MQCTKSQKCSSDSNIYLVILAPLLALSAPLLLLPIEKFFPFPHFIEEATKLIIVEMMIRQEEQTKSSLFLLAFVSGFLFAISESILYLVNFCILGNFSAFPLRIALTVTLHTGTIMLMYILRRKGYLGLVIGFIGSVVIHYFFNLWVAGL